MRQIFLLFAIASLAGCFGTDAIKTGKEGKPLPQFSVLLPDSTTWLSSAKIPIGKPFVVLCFSPYCPYCKAQTKAIIEDISKLKDVHFYFVSNFPLSSLKSFNKDFELSKYPNITVGMDTANAVANYFEIAAVPYLAIFNKNKMLNKTFEGKTYISQIVKATQE